MEMIEEHRETPRMASENALLIREDQGFFAGSGAGIAGIESREITALAYLRSIYQDPLQATHVRMKAAIAALPFEVPKLAVTAVIESGDLADRLDRAIARSARIIDARPARAEPPPPLQTSIVGPMASLRRSWHRHG
jgi:hypothetical protein